MHRHAVNRRLIGTLAVFVALGSWGGCGPQEGLLTLTLGEASCARFCAGTSTLTVTDAATGAVLSTADAPCGRPMTATSLPAGVALAYQVDVRDAATGRVRLTGSSVAPVTLVEGVEQQVLPLVVLHAVDDAAPVVGALDPSAEVLVYPAGATLTVTGMGFGEARGTSRVVLGDQELAVVSWADDAIEVQIPSTVGSGPLAVEVCGVASDPIAVTVAPVTVQTASELLGPDAVTQCDDPQVTLLEATTTGGGSPDVRAAMGFRCASGVKLFPCGPEGAPGRFGYYDPDECRLEGLRTLAGCPRLGTMTADQELLGYVDAIDGAFTRYRLADDQVKADPGADGYEWHAITTLEDRLIAMQRDAEGNAKLRSKALGGIPLPVNVDVPAAELAVEAIERGWLFGRTSTGPRLARFDPTLAFLDPTGAADAVHGCPVAPCEELQQLVVHARFEVDAWVATGRAALVCGAADGPSTVRVWDEGPGYAAPEACPEPVAGWSLEPGERPSAASFDATGEVLWTYDAASGELAARRWADGSELGRWSRPEGVPEGGGRLVALPAGRGLLLTGPGSRQLTRVDLSGEPPACEAVKWVTWAASTR